MNRTGASALPPLLLLLLALAHWGCASSRTRVATRPPGQFSHFIGLTNFSRFARTRADHGDTILLSPEIRSPSAWNQLIVSWNAAAPAKTFLKLEAAASIDGRTTAFYTLGQWSPDDTLFPRTSVRGQRDADGRVETDTLQLNRPAGTLRLRITLGGANGTLPVLKFLGLCTSDTRTPAVIRPPNRAAWGRIIDIPERSQHGYPDARGWCSPASLAMVLAHWAEVLHRPEINLTVPQTAAAVYDRDFAGTGNWPFNAAFAGSFPGMRGYVTRFDDLSEVEDWIAAGIPVILSARWDLLEPGRPLDSDGHLLVCIGFTDQGDVVVNEPATHLVRGETVRRIYRRANVIRAWLKSHDTVYLVYPEGAAIPRNRFGHW
jgi:hypothetical protein